MKQSQHYNFGTSSHNKTKNKRSRVTSDTNNAIFQVLAHQELSTQLILETLTTLNHTHQKMNKYKIQSSQQSLQKYQSQILTLLKSNSIPQIIKIIDFFKTKSSYYIITQYIEESYDLFRYMNMNRRKFCELQVRGIWDDLLVGIGKLHQLNVWHRDIKLQNVLYVPKNKSTKIIDFGMAQLVRKNEEEQSEKVNNSNSNIIGTPMFMSPQVINNQGYTSKCDIWSLGIVFYFMVYGKSPYKQVNSIKAIKQKLQLIKKNNCIEFDDDVWVSEKCKDVIRKCLKYQEKYRGQINEILSMPFFKRNINKQGKLGNQLENIQGWNIGFQN